MISEWNDEELSIILDWIDILFNPEHNLALKNGSGKNSLG
jgi:hypothetical protein